MRSLLTINCSSSFNSVLTRILRIYFRDFSGLITEASREEGRRHAAGLAILGVLIGVILISLATAATALPAYIITHPSSFNHLKGTSALKESFFSTRSSKHNRSCVSLRL